MVQLTVPSFLSNRRRAIKAVVKACLPEFLNKAFLRMVGLLTAGDNVTPLAIEYNPEAAAARAANNEKSSKTKKKKKSSSSSSSSSKHNNKNSSSNRHLKKRKKLCEDEEDDSLDGVSVATRSSYSVSVTAGGLTSKEKKSTISVEEDIDIGDSRKSGKSSKSRKSSHHKSHSKSSSSPGHHHKRHKKRPSTSATTTETSTTSEADVIKQR